MYFTMYPGKGKPTALTTDLDELLVLTYSAIESTNVERWALELGAPAAPVLTGTMRNSAYETDVVGNIHRLGQRYWLQRHEAAVWERPFPTGDPGRPPAVDISLFSEVNHKETRLEFGLYHQTKGTLTKKKIKDDAAGLFQHVNDTVAGYPTVENYIILWHRIRSPRTTAQMTAANRVTIRKKFSDHASAVTAGATGYTVELLKCSGGPLFTPKKEHHWVIIGLFKMAVI